ncbi:unnamed protein product [Protopolystoma xenopodis]|uniref:Uncharacterized protein n=1 Tax=Protopolystoma xenopodis TaxID=117903 RepID=A0A448XEU2_9PLAT|nr:unnamed protein product [Protopolystoma xenopodis]
MENLKYNLSPKPSLIRLPHLPLDRPEMAGRQCLTPSAREALPPRPFLRYPSPSTRTSRPPQRSSAGSVWYSPIQAVSSHPPAESECTWAQVDSVLGHNGPRDCGKNGNGRKYILSC